MILSNSKIICGMMNKLRIKLRDDRLQQPRHEL